MKKLILFVLLIVPFASNAQKLNEYAKYLKTNFPASYGPIREYAVEKWNEDHSMIVYEINEQSEALYFIITKIDFKDMNQGKIFHAAYLKWVKEPWSRGESALEKRADWVMIKHEFDEQFQASSEY